MHPLRRLRALFFHTHCTIPRPDWHLEIQPGTANRPSAPCAASRGVVGLLRHVLLRLRYRPALTLYASYCAPSAAHAAVSGLPYCSGTPAYTRSTPYHRSSPSPAMAAVISSMRSSGNGGSASGRSAMLMSFMGLSSAATRLE